MLSYERSQRDGTFTKDLRQEAKQERCDRIDEAFGLAIPGSRGD